jgi:hypothetical protein
MGSDNIGVGGLGLLWVFQVVLHTGGGVEGMWVDRVACREVGHWDRSFRRGSRVSRLVIVSRGSIRVSILYSIIIVLGNMGRADIVMFRCMPELQGRVGCYSSGNKQVSIIKGQIYVSIGRFLG